MNRRSRWLGLIYGLYIFRKSYLAIRAALGQISEDTSYEPDVRHRATGMKQALEKFQFVLSLVVAERGLKCTKPLTLQLQSPSLDAGKA